MLRRRCPSLKVRGVRRRSFILTVTVSFDSDGILLVDADNPPLMEGVDSRNHATSSLAWEILWPKSCKPESGTLSR